MNFSKHFYKNRVVNLQLSVDLCTVNCVPNTCPMYVFRRPSEFYQSTVFGWTRYEQHYFDMGSLVSNQLS